MSGTNQRRADEVLFQPSTDWKPRLPGPLELASGAWGGAVGRVAAPALSAKAGEAFAKALGAEPTPPREFKESELGDPGWFGPQSMSWRIHGDYSMFISGFASFALQALHPRALAGVIEHSAFDGDFMGRTRRTGEYVMTVTFGTSAEAERVTSILPRIHDRVTGITPDGRPYSANEPELLDYVHVTQFVATAAAHRMFGAHPLSDSELDDYISENAKVGKAVGVEDPPNTWAEAMASLDRHRPNLAVGEQAAEAFRYLAKPPFLHPAALPIWRVMYAGAIGCLPIWARTLIGGPRLTMSDLIACRAVVRNLGTLLPTPLVVTDAQRRLGVLGA